MSWYDRVMQSEAAWIAEAEASGLIVCQDPEGLDSPDTLRVVRSESGRDVPQSAPPS